MSQAKNLSEAAAEILKSNLASKKGEPFGVGKSGKEQHIDGSDPKGMDAVPHAVAPGKTQVGQEPMHKLDSQPSGNGKDIGNAGLDDYNLDDVPGAVAPGKTQVGQEPIHKLDSKKNPSSDVSDGDTKVDQLPKGKAVNEGDEDIEALMAGENLSEDFKRKATAIFEAAVKAKVSELAEELEAKYLEQFTEAYEEMKEDLSTKIDDYLNYVSESWLEENKLAVETGLKSELTESFINSLKQVFVEHYIDIPEDKVDVVEELASKVEALENQVNEELSKNISLKKQLSEQKKIEAVSAVCEGLTISQSEKIKSIAESVEFTSEEDFISQMVAIKESYFSKETPKPAAKDSLEDNVIIEDTQEQKAVDPLIAQYAKRISETTF